MRGGRGRFAQFTVEQGPAGAVALRCFAHEGRDNEAGGHGWYLGVAPDISRLVGNAGRGPLAQWHLVDEEAAAVSAAPAHAVFDHVKLPRDQVAQFKRDGFLHLRGVVDPLLVDRALARINHEVRSWGFPFLCSFSYGLQLLVPASGPGAVTCRSAPFGPSRMRL